MRTFMQTFERVAVKYAEYVEEKLSFSSNNIREIKPGQEIIFGEPEKAAEQFTTEMQLLNEIAQMLIVGSQLKDRLEEDEIKLTLEEMENLKVTGEELEEFEKKMVCFIERNEETGAVEIVPGNGEKIILNGTEQIRAFLQVVGSYLKGGTENGRESENGNHACADQ